MTGDGSLALAIQVLVGVSLAACCGLRAFLPPFVFGAAVRFGVVEAVLSRPVELHPGFEWMASTPALVVFGVALVAELLADKIPIVDNALDVVQTVVRPLAGTLVVAASLTELDPLPATVIGLIVGGSVAGGVHVAKSKTRIVSTLGTAGLASPVLSVAEDVVALIGSVLAVTVAVAAFLALAMLFAAGWLLLRMARRRRAVARASPAASP